MKSLEFTEKEGWYCPMDEDVYIYVSEYVSIPGYCTVLHYIKEEGEKDNEEMECDKWFVDFENKKGKVDVYHTIQSCKDAQKSELSFLEAKNALEKQKIIADMVPMLKKLDVKDVEKALEMSNFGYNRLVSNYAYDKGGMYEEAFDILRKNGFVGSFASDGNTFIPLNHIIRASDKNKTVTLELVNSQKYTVSEKNNRNRYNALCRIFNL